MYGIPNMKLDKEQVVLRRIKQLEAEGIRFVCNTDVGGNYPGAHPRTALFSPSPPPGRRGPG